MSVLVRNGILYIDFRFYLPNGKKKHACLSTGKKDNKKNHKKIVEFDKNIQYELKNNTFDYLRQFPNGKHAYLFREKKNNITFEEVYDEWMAGRILKSSTQDTYYATYKNYLAEDIGRMPIRQIEQTDIMIFRKELLEIKKLKRSTINDKPMKMIKMIMLYAYNKGYIEQNPCKLIKPLQTETVDINPLSLSDYGHLIAVLEKKNKNDWADLIHIWINTGLRPGELYALKWECVDFHNKKLLIRASRYKGMDGTPKTAKSNRDIDLKPKVLDALKRQKERTFLNGTYVFLTGDNKPFSDAFMRKKFKHIFQLAGLPYRPPKQMRHSFASLAIGLGENISWVSKTLGHSNIRTTAIRYNRFIPNLTGTDGSRLEYMLTHSCDSDGQIVGNLSASENN
jgi:integrase